jgi:hypothetical protein
LRKQGCFCFEESDTARRDCGAYKNIQSRRHKVTKFFLRDFVS